MSYSIDCPDCRKRFQVRFNPAGKQVKCLACGKAVAVPDADAEEVEGDEEESSPLAPRKIPPRSSGSWHRPALLVLKAGYFPFLAMLCLSAGGLALGLIVWGVYKLSVGDEVFFGLTMPRMTGIPAIVVGVVIGLAVLHVLWGLRALFWKDDDKDELEFELPDQWQGGLIQLVKKVADERGARPPELIRLHAVDVAKIYQDRRGRGVLVIGGLAVAAYSQRALSGIIAHEISHHASGDTALSRSAVRWHQVMIHLERSFWEGHSTHKWNPLAWLLRGYHFLYFVVWFANSRQQEYSADRFEVELVGKNKAAAALVLVTLLYEMEFAALGPVAEAFVETNQPMSQIFAEQVRRVRAAGPSEWGSCLRQSLRCRTGLFDSHPCLTDRLKALGVSPKKALKLAIDLMDTSGKPATALFGNWPVVEKFLTDRIMTIVRENYLAMQDAEAIYQAVLRQSVQGDDDLD